MIIPVRFTVMHNPCSAYTIKQGLTCFGFHCIIVFGTWDPNEAPESMFWFQLSHPSTFQFPLSWLIVLSFVVFIQFASLMVMVNCSSNFHNLLMVVFQCSSNFHHQWIFYCWGLLVHHKRASSLLQKRKKNLNHWCKRVFLILQNSFFIFIKSKANKWMTVEVPELTQKCDDAHQKCDTSP